jgi:hypothetical protein
MIFGRPLRTIHLLLLTAAAVSPLLCPIAAAAQEDVTAASVMANYIELDTRKNPLAKMKAGPASDFDSVMFTVQLRGVHNEIWSLRGSARFLRVSSLLPSEVAIVRRPMETKSWCARNQTSTSIEYPETPQRKETE